MKCGTQIQMDKSNPHPPQVPYRFCKNCLDEYLEFQKMLHGCGSSEYYWYNDEWIDTWKSWILYHKSLKRYEKSNGYRRLLEELTHK